jgi:hypothetical protein
VRYNDIFIILTPAFKRLRSSQGVYADIYLVSRKKKVMPLKFLLGYHVN